MPWFPLVGTSATFSFLCEILPSTFPSDALELFPGFFGAQSVSHTQGRGGV